MDRYVYSPRGFLKSVWLRTSTICIGYVGSKSFLQQLHKLVIELKELNENVKFGK